MFIPGVTMGYGMPAFTQSTAGLAPSIGRGLGLSRSLRGLSASPGLFRSVNWGGLLNNASKALGVVNQAVPLVKQAGPMVNNMKSMLKLASMFKDETDKDIKPASNKTSSIEPHTSSVASPSASSTISPVQSNPSNTGTPIQNNTVTASSENIANTPSYSTTPYTYTNAPNFFL